MSDTPDTSKANIARVLRDCAELNDGCGAYQDANECRALADALERQEDVTWKERVDLAYSTFGRLMAEAIRPFSIEVEMQMFDAALRAAFPDALEQQASVPWSERVEQAGLRMMPTAWPAMTPKERQVYIDRWEPIAKAFFPDLAPKEPTP